MKNFVFGAIFGLILGTVGVTGMLKVFDRSVDMFKTQAQELAK